MSGEAASLPPRLAVVPEAPPLATVLDEGIVDVLTVHDEEGRYLAVSASMEDLTGHAADDLVGSSPFEAGLVHPDDLDDVMATMVTALDGGGPFRTPYRLRRSDGVFVWVESTGRLLHLAEGPRFVLVTREAGHLDSLLHGVEYERRLQGQLEELLARQRRFLTTVSHRARTPLTAVHGMVETLHRLDDVLGASERAVLLQRVRANTDELLELLTDVTEADRLSRDDVLLSHRLVRLREAAAEAIGTVAVGDGPIENLVPDELTAVVDRKRVVRLLTLLVGNAVVHGGIGVHVWVRGRATDDGVELVVEDNGPGVPEDRRAAVFQAFTHGVEDAADPGAGLGLFIVAELAARHGGHVRLDDRPGGGARFRVRLPRPRAQDIAGAGRIEAADAGASSTLRGDTRVLVERVLTAARRRVGLDVVYLSILDDTHQHVLAAVGEPVAGIQAGVRIPIADTYCARMLRGELDRVVGATDDHPVTAALPITGDGLACWVGVPVHLPSGHAVGTLCAASATPDPDLSVAAADELEVFAELLGDQLADEGFVAGSVLDAAGRVAEVLTSDDAVQIVLQPVVDLRSGTVTGVEALTRFRGHDRPVDLWFADAARMGLDIDLEVHAVRLALARLGELDDDLRLAVNVAPRTLCSRELAHVLGTAHVERLVLELAEHASVADYAPLVAALRPWRREGLRLALDDVGTGYAGLGHLMRLEPDVVKVDRSVVTTLAASAPARAAIGGLVRLSESMGAALVAEGVEDEDTLHMVRDLGFTHVQGYLTGRPAPTLDRAAVESHARQLLDG